MSSQEFELAQGQLYQTREAARDKAGPILDLFKKMGEYVGKVEPRLVLENPGYRVLVYPPTEELAGLVPRAFVLDPQAVTRVMRSGGSGITRMRYCVEGNASLLVARANGAVTLIDMGDERGCYNESLGFRLPREINTGDTACIIAGEEGATVFDLAPTDFDPRMMESPVEFNDPSIPQEFWGRLEVRGQPKALS